MELIIFFVFVLFRVVLLLEIRRALDRCFDVFTAFENKGLLCGKVRKEAAV